MRTVEEFIAIVEEENKKYNENLLNKSQKMLIDRAWEIAKWQAIYNYIEENIIPSLECEEETFEDFLGIEIDDPIAEIYDFEFDYDEPMWTTWDNLEDLVRDMLEEMKN